MNSSTRFLAILGLLISPILVVVWLLAICVVAFAPWCFGHRRGHQALEWVMEGWYNNFRHYILYPACHGSYPPKPPLRYPHTTWAEHELERTQAVAAAAGQTQPVPDPRPSDESFVSPPPRCYSPIHPIYHPFGPRVVPILHPLVLEAMSTTSLDTFGKPRDQSLTAVDSHHSMV